jgi:hypothetical protein
VDPILPRDNILALELFFDNAGYLFFSAGEQDIRDNNEKIYRCWRHTKDNPFVGVANAKKLFIPTEIAIHKEW